MNVWFWLWFVAVLVVGAGLIWFLNRSKKKPPALPKNKESYEQMEERVRKKALDENDQIWKEIIKDRENALREEKKRLDDIHKLQADKELELSQREEALEKASILASDPLAAPVLTAPAPVKKLEEMSVEELQKALQEQNEAERILEKSKESLLETPPVVQLGNQELVTIASANRAIEALQKSRLVSAIKTKEQANKSKQDAVLRDIALASTSPPPPATPPATPVAETPVKKLEEMSTDELRKLVQEKRAIVDILREEKRNPGGVTSEVKKTSRVPQTVEEARNVVDGQRRESFLKQIEEAELVAEKIIYPPVISFLAKCAGCGIDQKIDRQLAPGQVLYCLKCTNARITAPASQKRETPASTSAPASATQKKQEDKRKSVVAVARSPLEDVDDVDDKDDGKLEAWAEQSNGRKGKRQKKFKESKSK